MAILNDARLSPSQPDEARHQAAKMLEAQLLKVLLTSSGAFKAGSAAGGGLRQDLFVDALADAVANAGGIGLAKQLETELGGKPAAVTPAAPPLPGPSAPAAESTELPLPPGVGRLTSGFGTRADPFDGHAAFHAGVDLAAPVGTPILAAEGGVVRRAGPDGGYGNLIEVDHGDGTLARYGHASKIDVAPGQHVQPGQVLGEVGATGRATGPHLHFELRSHGHAVDPTAVLKAYAKRVE